MLARFQTDWRKYEFRVVAESVWLSAKDAFGMERSFHEGMKQFSYRPTISLSSGNTECYQLSEINLAWLVEMIVAARPPKIEETVPIGGGVMRRKSGGFYRQPIGKSEANRNKQMRKLAGL